MIHLLVQIGSVSGPGHEQDSVIQWLSGLV